MYRRGPSLLGTLVSVLMFIFILRFAFFLLPYLLIGYLIWYFYRRLIKPLFSNGRGENTYERKENYRANTNKEEENEDPLAHQVKSVHDDQFFKQDHHVVDVDYEDEEE